MGRLIAARLAVGVFLLLLMGGGTAAFFITNPLSADHREWQCYHTADGQCIGEGPLPNSQSDSGANQNRRSCPDLAKDYMAEEAKEFTSSTVLRNIDSQALAQGCDLPAELCKLWEDSYGAPGSWGCNPPDDTNIGNPPPQAQPPAVPNPAPPQPAPNPAPPPGGTGSLEGDYEKCEELEGFAKERCKREAEKREVERERKREGTERKANEAYNSANSSDSVASNQTAQSTQPDKPNWWERVIGFVQNLWNRIFG